MSAPSTTYPGKSSDLIPLGDGLNFSTRLDRVDGTVVSSPLFFVRCNNPPPTLLARDWELRIEGRVQQPLTVRIADLQRLQHLTHEVWMECAGNSRTRFDPPTEGNQWDENAVSNAEFTGVALRDVLEPAGIMPDAIELVTTGADAGFQRGLPVDVALQPDTLLVWAMNGEPIPSVNGGPVRLLVPRWAGIASVKWPIRMELVDRPFEGYYNAQRYIMVDKNGQTLRTVRELPVKSVFAWPDQGAQLALEPHTLFGFAWSGFGSIEQVDVSIDGQRSWSPARLMHAGPLAWARWEFDWRPATSGAAQLAVRATDSAGNTQPREAAWNHFGYEMNAIATREVVVSA
jgi:DMSO/TMAO reductase YedYZ molybdopterin-dependent catalytic subunit